MTELILKIFAVLLLVFSVIDVWLALSGRETYSQWINKRLKMLNEFWRLVIVGAVCFGCGVLIGHLWPV